MLLSQVSIRDSNPNDPDQSPIPIPKFDLGLGLIFEKFGIGNWDGFWKIRDLGLSLENSGFGIGSWDSALKIQDMGVGFGFRSELFRDWDGIGIPNADLWLL